MDQKFYPSVTKGLNKKAIELQELIPTFVDFTGEQLVEEAFLQTPFLHPEIPIVLKIQTKVERSNKRQ